MLWDFISGRCNRFSLFYNIQTNYGGHNQSLTQWVAGALPLEVKWLGPEADHLPPTSARLRICGAIPPLPHTSS